MNYRYLWIKGFWVAKFSKMRLWKRSNFFKFKIVFFSLLILLLIVKSTLGLDPDFGWRLRTGYFILQNGIPKTDLYTYTMPSFPWVDHAWPISVFFSLIYSFLGKAGLALIFSVLTFVCLIPVIFGEDIITLSLEIKTKIRQKLAYFTFGESFVFVLALANLLPFSGTRAQVVTWLMFSLLVLVLLYRSLWEKWRYFLPVFFLIWGNIHGGFFAGLSALMVFTFFRFWRLKKIDLENFLILVVCILATLINPYGVGTWREAWSSVSDTNLRLSISEWMPIFLSFDLAIIAYHTLSFLFIYRARKIYTLEEKALYLFFLFQGITSARNIPLLVVLSLPLTLRAINRFYQEVTKTPLTIRRFKQVYIIAWVGSLLILIGQLVLNMVGAYALSEEKFYPKAAVSFIRKGIPQGNIFSEYGWGGYLIWKLPEKKVFIDGRMPSWKWNAGIPNETGSAMKDYQALLKGELSYREVFEKYQVDTVLWPQPKEDNFFTYMDKKLNEFLKRFGRQEKDFNFIKKLEEDGWQKIYEDPVSVIYQKPS